MVKVAPWQPVSEAFDIATPAAVNVDWPFAGTVWVTAVVVKVTPVVELDDRKIGDGKPGPLTKKIQKLFFDAVYGRNAQYRNWLTPVN